MILYILFAVKLRGCQTSMHSQLNDWIFNEFISRFCYIRFAFDVTWLRTQLTIIVNQATKRVISEQALRIASANVNLLMSKHRPSLDDYFNLNPIHALRASHTQRSDPIFSHGTRALTILISVWFLKVHRVTRWQHRPVHHATEMATCSSTSMISAILKLTIIMDLWEHRVDSEVTASLHRQQGKQTT